MKYDKSRKFPRKTNTAVLKYARDSILSFYAVQSPLELDQVFESVLIPSPQTPALEPETPFHHTLGDRVNARKAPREKKPKEEVPTAKVIIDSISEEEEAKRENEFEEENTHETTQTAVPKNQQNLFMTYNLNLLEFNKAKGIIFAELLLNNGKIVKDLVYMIPYTKPFEKVWFYKDPEQRVQGPFSTIEMFNWAARGCFPSTLPISFGMNGSFAPMSEFAMDSEIELEKEDIQPVKPVPVIEEKPVKTIQPSKSAAGYRGGIPLKDILGIKEPKKSAWEAEEFFPNSLKQSK